MAHNAKGIAQSAERLIRRLPQYHLPELQGERGKAQINANWRAVDGIKSWRETMKWEALRHWVQLQNLSWREAGHC